MRDRLIVRKSWYATIGLWGALTPAGLEVRAQDLPEPLPPTLQAAPPIADPPATPISVDQLAERLVEMEQRNRALAEELERSRQEHAEQMRQILDRLDEVSTRLRVAEAPDLDLNEFGSDGTIREAPPDPAMPGVVPDAPNLADLLGRRTLPEYTGPVPEYETQPIEPDPFLSPAPGAAIAAPDRRTLESAFGPGFQFRTLDEEFLLQVHIQSQVESRVWGDTGGTPYRSGFYLPRQRIFFNGWITRPIEYSFSINRGFGDLNILEAFLNFHPDDRFQIRFGRYFTPLGYDQFAVRNLWQPTPERSLFTTNLGPNRQVGLMAWGYLLDKRLDYAAGVFSGPRNSFEDFNNAKDFNGYLNARPFQQSEALPFARDLNLGASVAFGVQDQPAVPLAFRVGAIAPTNAVQAEQPAAPFLVLNRDVQERGARLLGSVHSAYFYRGLSLLGEWQYGYGNYVSPLARSAAEVPFSGYYVTAAYFLTGEEVDRRAMILPNRPLIPTRPGQRRGLGAWEAVARISRLELGTEIFDAGLADGDRWARAATTTELGVNWYWNEHLKVYIFWLHGDYSDPVIYAPGRPRDEVDMFWLRFQLYY